MRLLLALLFIVFNIGQLDRLNPTGGEVVFHFNDLAVTLFVVVAGLLRRRHLLKAVRQSSLSKPVIFFILAMAVSLAANATKFPLRDLLVSSLYFWRWIVYAGLYFAFLTFSESEKKLTTTFLRLSVILVAVSGLLQYFFLPNVAFLKAIGWDDHYYRLIGVFLDPGFTGAILAFGVLFFFLTRQSKINHWTGLLLSYSAMVLTYSRASYLLYLFSFAVVAVFRRSARIFLLAALVLGLAILVLPRHFGEGSNLSRENSNQARIQNWLRSLKIWSDHPVFGVGFNSYRYIQRHMGLISSEQVRDSHAGAGADSSLFLILATTGIVGFASYLLLLRGMWKVAAGNLLFRATLAGLLIHSFFNNTLLYPWVMEWLWILLAIS